MKILGMKKPGDEKPGMKVKWWNVRGWSVMQPISIQFLLIFFMCIFELGEQVKLLPSLKWCIRSGFSHINLDELVKSYFSNLFSLTLSPSSKNTMYLMLKNIWICRWFELWFDVNYRKITIYVRTFEQALLLDLTSKKRAKIVLFVGFDNWTFWLFFRNLLHFKCV